MNIEKISVVGLGYIGLPTAAMFASCRKQVCGVDVNPRVIEGIKSGSIHIAEPGLEDIVGKAVSEGWLSVSTKTEPSDVFVIAVPTPFKGENKEPDLGYVKNAIEQIAPVLARGNLIVLESTSPVGTTEKISKWISDLRNDLNLPNEGQLNPDINIAYCPERVLPGKILKELVENDRILGGITPQCSKAAKELYQLFVHGEFFITTAKTAELSKLAENSYRDVNIAFANELSMICEQEKIDTSTLIQVANRHPRVNILQPGPGVGGHCIAVDPWFIVHEWPSMSNLIRCARNVNDRKADWVFEKICENFDRSGYKSILVYGLTYKADVDDLRDSPALQIARNLNDFYPNSVFVVEPNIPKKKLELELGLASMGKDVDNLSRELLHVYLVHHSSFIGVAPADNVLDFCGLLDTKKAERR